MEAGAAGAHTLARTTWPNVPLPRASMTLYLPSSRSTSPRLILHHLSPAHSCKAAAACFLRSKKSWLMLLYVPRRFTVALRRTPPCGLRCCAESLRGVGARNGGAGCWRVGLSTVLADVASQLLLLARANEVAPSRPAGAAVEGVATAGAAPARLHAVVQCVAPPPLRGVPSCTSSFFTSCRAFFSTWRHSPSLPTHAPTCCSCCLSMSSCLRVFGMVLSTGHWEAGMGRA